MSNITKRERVILIVLAIFVALTFLRGCENRSVKSSMVKLQKKVDTLQVTQISKDEIIKAVKIEGLKTEKRMIQSTDRKMLDVQRQAAIDAELKALENEQKK